MSRESHICGVQGECNDYCGGGQLKNLRARAEKAESELSSLRKERDGKVAELTESAANHEMSWFTEKQRADHFQKLLTAIGYITSNTDFF